MDKKGTREMNNEPVAWMLNGIIHECDPSDWAKEQYPDQDVVPLYTHPVKELTIHEDIVYGLAYKYGIEKGDVLDFSRAILRKAQEK